MRACAAFILSLASFAVVADQPPRVWAEVLPIRIEGNFPVLTASINGTPIPLMLDLSENNAMVLQQAILDEFAEPPTGEIVRMQGVGVVYESVVHIVSGLKIGPETYDHLVTRSDVPHGDYRPGRHGEKGYLTAALFGDHVFEIDYQGRTLTIYWGGAERNDAKSCVGLAVPFLPLRNGALVTEAYTDWGQTLVWWHMGLPISARTQIERSKSKAAGTPAITRRFVLGGVDFGPVKFDVTEADLPGFDGYLAYDFLAEHNVCLDLPRRQLTIASPRSN